MVAPLAEHSQFVINVGKGVKFIGYLCKEAKLGPCRAYGSFLQKNHN